MNQEELFSYKPYLFTIAYNMLGDIAAAEDLVQDTFEKWLQSDRSEVTQPKAYLSRIIINKAIDCLEREKKKRATYKGVWLPEPMVAESTGAEENHTLEYALLFLMERLNPYERAVVVLKEVFAFSYAEIADFLEISQDNCRQLLHRSREKVRVSGRKQPADPARHQALLEAFLVAMYHRDFEQLKQLLHADVAVYQDGGGKVPAGIKPLFGIAPVTKFLQGILSLNTDAQFRMVPVFIHSVPAVVIYKNDQPDTIVYAVSADEVLTEVYFVRNPDKMKLDRPV
jgi:RNA polymerase sigma-70 factor (ECF subfamily)